MMARQFSRNIAFTVLQNSQEKYEFLLAEIEKTLIFTIFYVRNKLKVFLNFTFSPHSIHNQQ